MPALHNLKHENFCQLTVRGVAQGLSQATIYRMAGYRAEGHSAEMAASRLMQKDEIRVRLAELTAPAERKTRATVDDLSAQLDVVFAGASDDRQWGAAGSAAAVKAKLLGFMRERIEVGPVGSFGPSTVDEVLADVERELGPAAAAVMAWTLHDPDAPMPVTDIARTMLQAMSLDQALQHNEELRQALLRVASDGAQVVEATPQDREDQVDRAALAIVMQPKKKTRRG